MSETVFGCIEVSCRNKAEEGHPHCLVHLNRKGLSSSHVDAIKDRLFTAQQKEVAGRQLQLPHINADADFRECITACDKILTSKGHDYTQGDDRLKNFYRNGKRLGMPAAKILAVYMFKHMDAIETYLLKGAVESEPIEGRIHDAINYLLLLYKLVKQEKRDLDEENHKKINEAAQGR